MVVNLRHCIELKHTNHRECFVIESIFNIFFGFLCTKSWDGNLSQVKQNNTTKGLCRVLAIVYFEDVT